MSTDLMLIEKMEKSSNWLSENYESVYKEHTNEFVAIEENKIIAHDSRLDRLIEEIAKKGKKASEILIEFIYEKGTKFIL